MKHALVALLLCFCPFVFAQQAPKATAAQTSKEAKIRELIRLTGSADLAFNAMKTQVATIKKMLPLPAKAQDDFADQFFAAADINEFIDLFVPIYDKHFTESDLDGMLAFYRTPVGQKLIKELPAVAAESQQAGASRGRQIGEKVGAQIGARVRAGQYGPWPPSGSASHPAGEPGVQSATPAPPQN